MMRYAMVVMIVLSMVVSAPAHQSGSAFGIRRGVNISHWLSQSGRRGADRREWFTEKDVELIASLGFDHIRLPVDEEQLWDQAGKKEPEAFALLHKAIGWARESKLRVVVDLHILRSHHFNAKAIFTINGLPPFAGLTERELCGRLIISDSSDVAAKSKLAELPRMTRKSQIREFARRDC